MHRLYLQHQLLSSIPYTATVKSTTRTRKDNLEAMKFQLSQKVCDLIKTNEMIQRVALTREDKFPIETLRLGLERWIND